MITLGVINMEFGVKKFGGGKSDFDQKRKQRILLTEPLVVREMN